MRHTVIFTLALMFLLTGCGSENTASSSVLDSANQIPSVQDVLDEGTAQQDTSVDTIPLPTDTADTTEPSETQIPEGYGSYESVDIDLTTLSAVMVYTQVYAMVSNPDEYIGKTVKMHGTFGYYYEASVDTYYFGIIVQDATACCAQGIEFTLADEEYLSFPDDYPEPGAEATVVGVFNTYFPEEAPDWEYYRLEQAEFIL